MKEKGSRVSSKVGERERGGESSLSDINIEASSGRRRCHLAVGQIVGDGGQPVSGRIGMGESGGGPAMAPLNVERGDQERWRHFDSSVNAVSFGFVATAILISMFLIMAIFERFLRPQSPLFTSFTESRGSGHGRRRGNADLEAQNRISAGKLECASPRLPVYAKGVSVLMPGHDVPTFIAHPAPCPPERITWPSHQQIPLSDCSSSLS